MLIATSMRVIYFYLHNVMLIATNMLVIYFYLHNVMLIATNMRVIYFYLHNFTRRKIAYTDELSRCISRSETTAKETLHCKIQIKPKHIYLLGHWAKLQGSRSHKFNDLVILINLVRKDQLIAEKGPNLTKSPPSVK